jgi:hypothetical protein
MKPLIERRSEHRLSFKGKIPGHIQHNRKELDFVPFDISKKGLGLYLNPCPNKGEELSLLLRLDGGKIRSLQFMIKHIYEDTDETGMRRCGVELKTQGLGIDLIELLSRYL